MKRIKIITTFSLITVLLLSTLHTYDSSMGQQPTSSNQKNQNESLILQQINDYIKQDQNKDAKRKKFQDLIDKLDKSYPEYKMLDIASIKEDVNHYLEQHDFILVLEIIIALIIIISVFFGLFFAFNFNNSKSKNRGAKQIPINLSDLRTELKEISQKVTGMQSNLNPSQFNLLLNELQNITDNVSGLNQKISTIPEQFKPLNNNFPQSSSDISLKNANEYRLINEVKELIETKFNKLIEAIEEYLTASNNDRKKNENLPPYPDSADLIANNNSKLLEQITNILASSSFTPEKNQVINPQISELIKSKQALESDKENLTIQIKQLQTDSYRIIEEFKAQISKANQEMQELQNKNYALDNEIKQLKNQNKSQKIPVYPPNTSSDIIELVSLYNRDIGEFSQSVKDSKVAEVAEDQDSYENRYKDTTQPIILKDMKQDNLFWIIKSRNDNLNYLLFPKKRSVNTSHFAAICGNKSLFKSNNTHEGGNFTLITPAKVSLINSSKGEWRLMEPGELQFTRG